MSSMNTDPRRPPQPAYDAALRIMQVLLALAVGLPMIDFTRVALGKIPDQTVGLEEALVFASFVMIGVYFFWSYIGVVAKWQHVVAFGEAVLDLSVMLLSIGVLVVMGQTWSDTRKFVFFSLILGSIDLIWEVETLIVYREYRNAAKRLLWKRFVKSFVRPGSKEFDDHEKDTTATLWWLGIDIAEIALLATLLLRGVSTLTLASVIFVIEVLVPPQIAALRHQFWIDEGDNSGAQWWDL